MTSAMDSVGRLQLTVPDVHSLCDCGRNSVTETSFISFLFAFYRGSIFTKKSIVLLYSLWDWFSFGFSGCCRASWVNGWGRILLRFVRCVSSIAIFEYRGWWGGLLRLGYLFSLLLFTITVDGSLSIRSSLIGFPYSFSFLCLYFYLSIFFGQNVAVV